MRRVLSSERAVSQEVPPFQEKEQENLGDQNAGHADDKGGMLCLVAEELHAQNGADASAQDGGEKQGFFGNPPFSMAGSVLVLSHQKEGE